MKNIYALWSRACAWLRICPTCRTWNEPCDPLCPACWQALLMHKNSRLKSSPIQSDYLFAWTDNNALKSLIYFLKYHRHTEAYYKLAQHFMPRHLPPPGALFIPAPASLPGLPNHALFWAQALAQAWQGQVLDVLKRAEPGPQKQRTRQKRRDLQLQCRQPIDAQKYIVFCDDLVTTGSTAKAAWRCLGKPKNFAVWSLAYRPLKKESHGKTAQAEL